MVSPFENLLIIRDSHDHLPEFMANLGYVGQFSPSALQTSNLLEEERKGHGLNGVLEQWLVDALVAGRTET
jgi:hypothetical protein